jgi:AhpC/TSA family
VRRAVDCPHDEAHAQVCKLAYGSSGFALATVASMTETAVQVGAMAPDFEAPDENGNTWRLSEAVTRAVQVLVFYRGDW